MKLIEEPFHRPLQAFIKWPHTHTNYPVCLVWPWPWGKVSDLGRVFTPHTLLLPPNWHKSLGGLDIHLTSVRSKQWCSSTRRLHWNSLASLYRLAPVFFFFSLFAAPIWVTPWAAAALMAAEPNLLASKALWFLPPDSTCKMSLPGWAPSSCMPEAQAVGLCCPSGPYWSGEPGCQVHSSPRYFTHSSAGLLLLLPPPLLG